MKTLIVEDDFISRLLLSELLKSTGTIHIAVNGQEAVKAVDLAIEAQDPYDLICLDIMMPEMDGQEALRKIRSLEDFRGVKPSRAAKIIMTTALGDYRNVMTAYKGLCDAYLAKPIDRQRLMEELGQLGLP
jgi:two-component system chemotaxis response regulator CheY